MTNTRNETGDMMADHVDIKMMIRACDEQHTHIHLMI